MDFHINGNEEFDLGDNEQEVYYESDLGDNAEEGREEFELGGLDDEEYDEFDVYSEVPYYEEVDSDGSIIYHDAHIENVYVDGSCLGNGMYASKAGFGIWYGPDDRRNTSVTIKHGRKTNNRAELEAIMWAIHREIDRGREIMLLIHTDSQYAINCLENYYPTWERNGFLNANGRPVMNQELIRECKEAINQLEGQGCRVQFIHVPGHSGIEGNEAAHLLAIQGAKGQGSYRI